MSKLADLTPDKKNANRGTQRGLKALDTSLRQYGAGRSILLDRDNRIIAGNKTAERAADIGIDDVQIVDSDGTKLVAVRRTDLDLEDDGGKARALATYDNRVGELDLDWDAEALSLVDDDVLKDLNLLQDGIDYNEAWKGMPEFEQEDKEGIILTVHFLNKEDREDFLRKIGCKYTDKTKTIWYPERPEYTKNQLGSGLVYTNEP